MIAVKVMSWWKHCVGILYTVYRDNNNEVGSVD